MYQSRQDRVSHLCTSHYTQLTRRLSATTTSQLTSLQFTTTILLIIDFNKTTLYDTYFLVCNRNWAGTVVRHYFRPATSFIVRTIHNTSSIGGSIQHSTLLQPTIITKNKGRDALQSLQFQLQYIIIILF